jgi:flagellin
MIINHNIAALNTYNKLSSNSSIGNKALEKLSSGLRINRAGDDAAGLAISEKMRGQIRGLDQAGRNAQDGISMIQTAEGALNETHSILQRMRELAVQSATGTNTEADRAEIQKEIDQLATEITRISTDTEFNTKKLLNGDMGKTYTASVLDFQPQGFQITGSDITTGTYTLTMTSAGTDTFVTSGSSLNGAVDQDTFSVTAGAHISYGNYHLEVTDYDDVANTATFTLTGPDGTKTTISGASTVSDLDIGGLTIDLGTDNITQAGAINIALSANGMDIDLSGAKTVSNAPFNYSGGTLNIGGFEFEVKTNYVAGTNAFTIAVTDHAVKFQIGANANQNTSLSINDMSATALGVDGLVVTNHAGANAAISTIDEAITRVSAERSKLGAMQNRLEHTINNLGTTSENLSASESRVRDVDMAKEMMNFTKMNILSQAATAMLAQANQQPQNVLQLLR